MATVLVAPEALLPTPVATPAPATRGWPFTTVVVEPEAIEEEGWYFDDFDFEDDDVILTTVIVRTWDQPV